MIFEKRNNNDVGGYNTFKINFYLFVENIFQFKIGKYIIKITLAYGRYTCFNKFDFEYIKALIYANIIL